MTGKFLTGKTALITGSTSGIGLGLAKALATSGANIVLNGFGDHKDAEAQIKAQGVRVMFHGADMRSTADIEDMVLQSQRTFGQIDIVINNAGIQHVSAI